MTCSKYPLMLSRLLDQELSHRETAEVEGHLAQCADCRALMEHWRLQSTRLRSHLGRYRLGDDFVARVLSAEPLQERGAGHIGHRAPGRRGLARWLPAAAAILAAAIILSQLFSSRGGVGYARVIDPGELEVLQSSVWVRATAGELLHAGDSLRNPGPGAPEILWRDSCRLTLEGGALAHIPDSRLQPPDNLILIHGSLSSEIQAGTRDFQVRTPAGSVSSAAGRFSVRVTDLMLPHLEVAADQSEILTGTVRRIGEVSVRDGKARVQAAQATREVSAGETAVFSESEFANTVASPKPVRAFLRVVANASEKGALSSSLTVTAEGLCVNVEATNISLKKLLEWATATGVRGGEDTVVAGSLRFPANSSPESVASAVGAALGLPVSFRQEKAHQALSARQQNPTPTPEWTKGEFTFERSRNGLISFDFRSIPAAQVFQILRSAVTDLPELSAEEEWVPITLHASELNPGETMSWVTKTLGLRLGMMDRQVGVIEIESPAMVSPATKTAAPSVGQVSPVQTTSSRDGQSSGTCPEAGELLESTAAPRSITSPEDASVVPAQLPVMRPLWSVLGGDMSGAGFYPITTAGGSQTVVKGKASSKTPGLLGVAEVDAKPRPSLHLIWPAVGLEGASEGESQYLVTNHMGLPAHTLWIGYDHEGQLVARYEVVVNGSSTLALLPPRDLPADIGEGGHWETLSSVPLVGSRAGGAGGGLILGIPAESERLRREWSFPSTWLSKLGVRMWLVNPTEEYATVVLGILRGGKAITTEQLHIPPHGGRIWPEVSVANGPGITVVFYVLQGSVATGLIK